MLIIAVQNTKGGATKSTTTVSLGRAFQRKGYSVAYGETDPQGSLREWYADNPIEQARKQSLASGESDQAAFSDQPKVFRLDSRDSILSIRENPQFSDVDIFFIDGEAGGFRSFLAAAKVANLILIVTQPSPSDVKPIEEMIDACRSFDATKAFLITRTRKGDDLVDYVRNGLLKSYDLPVLNNTIRDLKGFKTSYGVGQTVFEFSDYKHAQEDVNAVADEIFQLLGVE